MGRSPCCEKMGLKKGPWTAEEDQILITYINQYGHGNWRALPKRAGLLRCGKSCRLRWMNYLRPDIKRGNFTCDEEETIIKLHQELGNRWSAIAARLPGRTDNEIKNVWHTHLKKRLNKQSQPEPKARPYVTESSDEDTNSEPNSPLHSSSEMSSLTNAACSGGGGSAAYIVTDSSENLPEMDESFWSEVLSGDYCGATSDFSSGNSESLFQFSNSFGSDFGVDDDMDFWSNLFNRVEDFVELPEF